MTDHIAFAKRVSKALAEGLAQEDYDRAQRLFDRASRMLALVERLALGSRLDERGLNHDDDSLAELAARIPNAGCRYTYDKLRAIAREAMVIYKDFIR